MIFKFLYMFRSKASTGIQFHSRITKRILRCYSEHMELDRHEGTG